MKFTHLLQHFKWQETRFIKLQRPSVLNMLWLTLSEQSCISFVLPATPWTSSSWPPAFFLFLLHPHIHAYTHSETSIYRLIVTPTNPSKIFKPQGYVHLHIKASVFSVSVKDVWPLYLIELEKGCGLYTCQSQRKGHGISTCQSQKRSVAYFSVGVREGGVTYIPVKVREGVANIHVRVREEGVTYIPVKRQRRG